MQPDNAFQARLGDRAGRRRAAAGVVVAAAIVGFGWWAPGEPVPSTAPAPLPSVPLADPSLPLRTPAARTTGISVEPGPFALRWNGTTIRLRVPAGWSATPAGTAVYRDDGLPGHDPDAPTISVHAVTRVVDEVCGTDHAVLSVGPTVADLATALTRVVGIERLGPVDVSLGGFPAKRLVLTLAGSCPGPESRLLWDNAAGRDLRLAERGSATVYVVEVNDARLVIVASYRRYPMRAVAELARVVNSIEIIAAAASRPESSPTVGGPDHAPGPPVLVRRLAADAGRARISFDLPRSWEGIKDGVYASKSIAPPQDAEAIVYWAAFEGGRAMVRCPDVLPAAVGDSAGTVADAVARAEGTQLVAAPTEVEVGGRRAMHVVVRVREARGCEPGFFSSWTIRDPGATWSGTRPGDTIRVWVVDVDGSLVLIASETRADIGPELELEVERIVASVELE